MDLNVLVTALLGAAGILGTGWGSWYQLRANRRASEHSYRRDLYAEIDSTIDRVLSLEHELRWAREDGRDSIDTAEFLLAVGDARRPLFKLMLLGDRGLHQLARVMYDEMHVLGNAAADTTSTRESILELKRDYGRASKALREAMIADLRRLAR